MTLLDTVLGAAARFSDPGASGVMTVDLHVSFIGPARGKLVGEGRVLQRAGRTVFCEGEVRGEDGGLVAKAMGTFKLRLRDA
jgi:acyl-coenzyme A thioesterase PaaI-like protein